MNGKNELKFNKEGYFDPTAYEAMKHISEDEERFQKLLKAIFNICDLANFKIENRIVLKDNKTGKIYP